MSARTLRAAPKTAIAPVRCDLPLWSKPLSALSERNAVSAELRVVSDIIPLIGTTQLR
jgi:hypothetical protein